MFKSYDYDRRKWKSNKIVRINQLGKRENFRAKLYVCAFGINWMVMPTSEDQQSVAAAAGKEWACNGINTKIVFPLHSLSNKLDLKCRVFSVFIVVVVVVVRCCPLVFTKQSMSTNMNWSTCIFHRNRSARFEYHAACCFTQRLQQKIVITV